MPFRNLPKEHHCPKATIPKKEGHSLTIGTVSM